MTTSSAAIALPIRHSSSLSLSPPRVWVRREVVAVVTNQRDCPPARVGATITVPGLINLDFTAPPRVWVRP